MNPATLNLEAILDQAAINGAETVLFGVGRPPVSRVRGELQKPLHEQPLSFHETAKIAGSVLPEEVLNTLNESGSVEAPFEIGSHRGMVTVFFGMGAHNLVFHLDKADG